jgi:diacylglycerol kinase
MWTGRIKSFRDAFRGLWYTIRTQQNAQIHLVITAIALSFGAYVGLTATEWCLAFVAVALVLGAEGLNTAIEELTDLVSPGYHPQAGRVKDTAAGGVLVCAICAAIIGIFIFGPHVVALFYP